MLANDVFGDDVRLDGLMVSDAGIIICTSQRFITAGNIDEPHPSQQQIYRYLMDAGFCYEEGSWVRDADGILVDDAHPGNFILAENNLLVPIDLKLRKLASL